MAYQPGIGDDDGGADDPDLADALRAHRIDVRTVRIDPVRMKVGDIGVGATWYSAGSAARGITALVAATEDAADQHESLRIVVDDVRPVLTPLHITGLDSELALYDTIADAMRGRPQHQPAAP